MADKIIRGEFQNRQRAEQTILFSGMRWGTITPTDIDFCIEYQNKLWVIAEIKMVGKAIPYGQKLALERLTADLEKTGKPVLCAIAEHNTPISKGIIAKTTNVREYLWESKWRKPKKPINLLDAINKFLAYHNKERAA